MWCTCLNIWFIYQTFLNIQNMTRGVKFIGYILIYLNDTIILFYCEIYIPAQNIPCTKLCSTTTDIRVSSRMRAFTSLMECTSSWLKAFLFDGLFNPYTAIPLSAPVNLWKTTGPTFSNCCVGVDSNLTCWTFLNKHDKLTLGIIIVTLRTR